MKLVTELFGYYDGRLQHKLFYADDPAGQAEINRLMRSNYIQGEDWECESHMGEIPEDFNQADANGTKIEVLRAGVTPVIDVSGSMHEYYSPSCPWNAPGMSPRDFI